LIAIRTGGLSLLGKLDKQNNAHSIGIPVLTSQRCDVE
jgi:hypothetical protein